MEPTLITSWEVILDRMRKIAAADPRLRDALQTVAGAVLSDMEQLGREPSSSGTGGASPRVEPAHAVPAAPPDAQQSPATPNRSPVEPDTPAAPVDLPRVEAPLRLGGGVLRVRVRGTAEEAREAARAVAASSPPRAATPDAYEWSRSGAGAAAAPDLIARRAALKAEACRWVLAKRREPASEAVSEQHPSLIARAKALPNCYLWMVHPCGPMLRAGHAEAEALAGCYDALAGACRAVAGAPGDGPDFLRALRLVAEAQSALRAMIAQIDEGLFDTDQRDAFGWVRQQAADRGVFLERYMRVDDAADPDAWFELRDRTAAFRAEREQGEARQKARAALMGKVKYHAGRLRQGTSPDPDGDWQKLLTAVDDAVADGVPPSDAQLRNLLLPIVDVMPEGAVLGPKAQAVWDELDRYAHLREEQERQSEREQPSDRDVSPTVRRAAELLRGRQVVLIGGEARRYAKRALERAFELDQVVWLSGKVHSSFYEFEPAVARPATAVVLLAVRWSSHGFGEVRALCQMYGKPLVRLPGGYNPEQVAQQVLDQVGEQLAAHA